MTEAPEPPARTRVPRADRARRGLAARLLAASLLLTLAACGGGGGGGGGAGGGGDDDGGGDVAPVDDGRVAPYALAVLDGYLDSFPALRARATEVTSIGGSAVVEPGGSFSNLPIPVGANDSLLLVADADGSPLAVARREGSYAPIDAAHVADGLVLMTSCATLVATADRDDFVSASRSVDARTELERLVVESLRNIGSVFDVANVELMQQANACAKEAWDRLASTSSAALVAAHSRAATVGQPSPRGVRLKADYLNVVAVNSSMTWYGLEVVDASGSYSRTYLIRPKARLNEFLFWRAALDAETLLALPTGREYGAKVFQGFGSNAPHAYDPASAAGKARYANLLTIVRFLLERLGLEDLLEYETIEAILASFRPPEDVLRSVESYFDNVEGEHFEEILEWTYEFLRDNWEKVQTWIWKVRPQTSAAHLARYAEAFNVLKKAAPFVEGLWLLDDLTNKYMPFLEDLTTGVRATEFCFTVTPAGGYLPSCEFGKPAPDFRWSPASPVVGETVRLDAGSTVDDDYASLLYRWDFDGDGTFDTPPMTASWIEHEFPTKGNVDVTVEATDGGGASGRVTRRIYVAPVAVAAPPPASSPSISGTSPTSLGASDSQQTLTVLGANFAQGCTATLKNLGSGATDAGKSVAFVHGGKVIVTHAFKSPAAAWTVTIVNPGGLASQAHSFSTSTSAAVPDLRVTNGSVSLSGSLVNASWTIKNVGAATANASTTVVRITESTSSSTGTNLDTIGTSSLAAGASKAQSTSLSAPTTPGTYYVWVITDNTDTAGQSATTAEDDIVRIGSFTIAGSTATGPDLRVVNGSVSLSGTSVGASWTIKNAGETTANASTTVVRINQSTSSAAGSNLATISTASLAGGATKSQSASLTAPSAAGTYQVWVITDNTRTAGQSASAENDDLVRIGSFTVTAASDPDLKVLNGSVSLSGTSVSASWTIKNAGSGTASASTTVVRINQSTSSAAGSNLDTISTSSLAAGATKSQSTSLTAPSATGTYHVWVITDNTSTAGQSTSAADNDLVRIGSFTVTAPDLQVQNGAVSLSGTTVSASWKIKNTGTKTAASSTTVVRINQSTTSASGSNLDTISTSSLAGGASKSQSTSLTAPSAAGTYYVWVITDNTSTAGQTTATEANDIVRIGSFTK